jgi:hypothetical protein
MQGSPSASGWPSTGRNRGRDPPAGERRLARLGRGDKADAMTSCDASRRRRDRVPRLDGALVEADDGLAGLAFSTRQRECDGG